MVDKTWFLWKHLLRHGTARDFGYIFWPTDVHKVWPVTGRVEPMPYLRRLFTRIVNRGYLYYPGALHLAHGMPPGVQAVDLEQSARKRAAYREALGEAHTPMYFD